VDLMFRRGEVHDCPYIFAVLYTTTS